MWAVISLIVFGQVPRLFPHIIPWVGTVISLLRNTASIAVAWLCLRHRSLIPAHIPLALPIPVLQPGWIALPGTTGTDIQLPSLLRCIPIPQPVRSIYALPFIQTAETIPTAPL